MWVISKEQIRYKNSTLTRNQFDNYYFYSNQGIYSDKNKTIKWFYDGYITSRQNSEDRFKPLTGYSLLEKVFAQYKEDFIHHVKGNFIIIMFQNNSFKIFSDRFGIKKFFYWKIRQSFTISDDIGLIVSERSSMPSRENMIIYSLFYHFSGARTFFDEVYHNLPAEIISLKNYKLEKGYYWNPENLLIQVKKKISIKEISEVLSLVVDSNLDLIDKDRISLSLTGGADTRNLLAIFLNRKIRPHLYTYGNPLSADCIKASRICKALNLRHEVHDIQMDSITFEKYARKIIKGGGGLASIHRVHRIIAIERERAYADSMFLGTLGGEYIKGVSEDDYIVPSLVYDNWTNSTYNHKLLGGYFDRKRLRNDVSISDSIIDFIRNEPYMKGDILSRKHNALNYLTAHLHDAQDVNLYNEILDYVFTPFLDIDYMETLFSSQFTFDQKEVVPNKILRRLENPLYASQFLQKTYKPLTKFRYSGEHIPSEVLFNKYYAGFMKVIRKKIAPNYPANFPLSQWMETFVKRNLPLCNNYRILRETYDIDGMIKDLNSVKLIPKESFWLKYTNPIMMRFIIEELNP
ncbi:MAG: hypothetical protein KQI35_03555 [Bacteroidetes bacterium]|nr:hypothetical protein [Bacteroidota bacterium]